MEELGDAAIAERLAHLLAELLARGLRIAALDDTEAPLEDALHDAERRPVLAARPSEGADVTVPVAHAGEELVHEPRLADARAAEDGDDLGRLGGERPRESLVEFAELEAAADERRKQREQERITKATAEAEAAEAALMAGKALGADGGSASPGGTAEAAGESP
jgi:hypothetical protein